MSPDTVFALLASLGGRLEEVYVIGCEPADLSAQMGLSPAVVGRCRRRHGRRPGTGLGDTTGQRWPGPDRRHSAPQHYHRSPNP